MAKSQCCPSVPLPSVNPCFSSSLCQLVSISLCSNPPLSNGATHTFPWRLKLMESPSVSIPIAHLRDSSMLGCVPPRLKWNVQQQHHQLWDEQDCHSHPQIWDTLHWGASVPWSNKKFVMLGPWDHLSRFFNYAPNWKLWLHFRTWWWWSSSTASQLNYTKIP